MADIKTNGVRLFYRDEGGYRDEGWPDRGSETIVFSHGLLLDHSIFDHQISHFKDRYRCIAYDHRGQGASESPRQGYNMDNLAKDAAGLIEELGVGPCHFAGLSIGGFVGLRLAITRPDLVKSLILIDSSADRDSIIKNIRFQIMNFIARKFGLEVVADRVLPIMFGQTFINDPARDGELQKWRLLMIQNDPQVITRAVRGVINRKNIEDRLSEIGCPTLIIVGEEDAATPPDHSGRLYRGIRGSKLVTIPRAGHISTVEEPEAVNQAIEEFLAKL